MKKTAVVSVWRPSTSTLQGRVREREISDLNAAIQENLTDEEWLQDFCDYEAKRPIAFALPRALVVVTPGAAGTLLVDCAHARREARYRVFKQVPTVDANSLAVATVTDSDAALIGLPSGKTVKVAVTDVNDAGESAPSAKVQAVVG